MDAREASHEERERIEEEFDNRFFWAWKIALAFVGFALTAAVVVERQEWGVLVTELLLGLASFLIISVVIVAVVVQALRPGRNERQAKEKEG